MKYCVICNKEKSLNDFRKVKNKYYRNTCKCCEKELNILAYDETLKYIQSLKNECCICGYDKCKSALDFHHIDPNTKKYTIGSLNTRKWSNHTKNIIDIEKEKCIIVCKNCHVELHKGLINLNT